MNELALKLKNKLVAELLHNDQNSDQPYLHVGQTTYTRRQIADEIERETEFGINQMTNMLLLSLDLIARKKEKV